MFKRFQKRRLLKINHFIPVYSPRARADKLKDGCVCVCVGGGGGGGGSGKIVLVTKTNYYFNYTLQVSAISHLIHIENMIFQHFTIQMYGG